VIDSQFLEKVWGEILSRRPARIRRMFATLDPTSQQEMLNHLKRMVTEEGWQEGQIINAQKALNTLKPSSSERDE
jgi:hypothetical protein